MGGMTAMAGGAGGAAGGAGGGKGALAQYAPMIAQMLPGMMGGQQQQQQMPPGQIVQPNFTMRGSMPAYTQAQPAQGAQNLPALFAAMFPQYMSNPQGPQFGRHVPTYQNNWQMDAQGNGVPPATTPTNSPSGSGNGNQQQNPGPTVPGQGMPPYYDYYSDPTQWGGG